MGRSGNPELSGRQTVLLEQLPQDEPSQNSKEGTMSDVETRRRKMRIIADHIVEGDSANHQLTIAVTDAPGAGGANHRYEITGFDTASNPSHADAQGYAASYSRELVLFQNGPIQEVGVNGVTHEAMLAIIIDRLRGFQRGPYACRENAIALTHCEDALMWLQRRTRERIRRGVEGTHAK
jgi:hypothetical protein